MIRPPRLCSVTDAARVGIVLAIAAESARVSHLDREWLSPLCPARSVGPVGGAR